MYQRWLRSVLNMAQPVYVGATHLTFSPRSLQNRREPNRQRVVGEPDRHGVLCVAADHVERKLASREVDVAADLELVGAGRSIVQFVATELPERRHTELVDVDTVLQRPAVPAVLRTAQVRGDRRDQGKRPF